MTIRGVKKITLSGGDELYIDDEKYTEFRCKAVAEVTDNLKVSIDYTPHTIYISSNHEVRYTGELIAYKLEINRSCEPWFLDSTIEEMKEAIRERLTIHYCLQSLKT